MPMSRDLSRSARASSGFVVHLDENVHVRRKRCRLEFGGGGVFDRGHDDENAVGACGARLRHLVGVVHEILAQHRQRARRTRGAQMIE